MKIAVMGAGAVGCYYGAVLARAGHEVMLSGREAFVRAVRATGLVLEAGGVTAAVRVEAMTDPGAFGSADLIIFCVKSADTAAAGLQLAPILRANSPVLSLQNGVDNPQRLAAVLGRPVVPVAVYVAVEMAAPAHVKHLGRGDLVMGRFAESEEVAAAFVAAGIPVRVSDEVVAAQWQKFITNCCYNAFSAIARMPYGRLVQVSGVPQVMTDVATECVAVGRALGGESAGIGYAANPGTRCHDARPIFVDGAGSCAPQAHRDRLSQWLRGAPGCGARHSDAGQSGAAHPRAGAGNCGKIHIVLTGIGLGCAPLVLDEIAASLCLGKPRVAEYINVLQRAGAVRSDTGAC